MRGLLDITLNMGVSSSCVLFFFSTFGGPTSAWVKGLDRRVWSVGCRVSGFGLRVQGLGFRFLGSGFGLKISITVFNIASVREKMLHATGRTSNDCKKNRGGCSY